MQNIYQTSLDEKFAAIVMTMARGMGYGDSVIGLIAKHHAEVIGLAEQAIFAWAIERQKQERRLTPVSNLQHLLDEYCAIADHL